MRTFVAIGAAVVVGACGLAGCAGKGGPPGGVQGGPRVVAGTPTIEVTKEEVDRFRDPVAVGEVREAAIALLLDTTRDPYELARATSLEALRPVPGRLAEVIEASLRDSNPGVRSAAALMVGRSKISRATGAVRPLLSDAEPRVRAAAIYALAANGVEVDRTPLADMLLGGPTPAVRAQAAFVLGELGDRSAVGLLRDAARRPAARATASEVRLLQLQIAEALVKLGEESQLEVIRAALYPSRPEELEASALAVQIMGQVRDRGSIDNLLYLTAARDEQGNPMPAEIRLGAAGALARMGLNQGTFLADEFAGNPVPALRAQAASVYGEIGRRENLAKLAKMIRTEKDPSVQVAAAGAMVRITSGPITGAEDEAGDRRGGAGRARSGR